tara:strand:+ start:352 stop:2265 length:1914 start_codon:yes stop_codon:yes gene_type:complete
MVFKKLAGCSLIFFSLYSHGQAVSSAYSQSDKILDVVTSQTQLLWGDTHVHTVLSGDSALFGNKLVGPDEAYRFAKGEVVQASLGKPAQLETPLDFLLVSDHAETMSAIWQLRHPTAEQQQEQRLQLALNIVERGLDAIPANVSQIETVNVALSSAAMFLLDGSTASNRAANSAWQEIIASAERHNQPGEFTALIGYEWSSTPNGDNLHRVVMYRDGAEKVSQTHPVSVIAAMMDPTAYHPEKLWNGLQDYEDKTGGQVLAIPHNSNLSSGLMFDVETSTGPMSKAYASTRKRWEPVVEITQIKGDSESHPFLSPGDEFADYDNWDKGNIFNNRLYTNEMLAGSYVREGLKRGLAIKADVGVNPYQFGVIGSTDSHTGLATADHKNFWGKSPVVGPTAERISADWSTEGEGGALVTVKNSESAASGYAAVWAAENTRAAIFDAFKRREVYASTGPRIAVRFFGGFGYTDDDLYDADFAAAGYRGGVPMGGELTASMDAPVFMLSALKDPKGANLDRIQVIKGWQSVDGQLHERIYDVAVSDNRRIKRNGRVRRLVGNTVNVKTADFKNSIGEVALATRWTDPDFNPQQAAFYYARVLEIPTPRWTTYDAVNFNQSLPNGVSATTQERAYTSAIWYQP